MRLAKVVGNVVSTIKDEYYHSYKLMLVEFFQPNGTPEDTRKIAFDCVDAGIGDIVIVNTDGGAGNILLCDDMAIVDFTICGIIDSYTEHGKETVINC
jgi:microcompartment protein CcmK/EutM